MRKGAAKDGACRWRPRILYGDPLVHPQTEDDAGNVNPIGERACYDEGKRVAETLLMDARRTHRVDARIIRIFNTYGPRMAFGDGRVVSPGARLARDLEGRIEMRAPTVIAKEGVPPGQSRTLLGEILSKYRRGRSPEEVFALAAPLRNTQ